MKISRMSKQVAYLFAIAATGCGAVVLSNGCGGDSGGAGGAGGTGGSSSVASTTAQGSTTATSTSTASSTSASASSTSGSSSSGSGSSSSSGSGSSSSSGSGSSSSSGSGSSSSSGSGSSSSSGSGSSSSSTGASSSSSSGTGSSSSSSTGTGGAPLLINYTFDTTAQGWDLTNPMYITAMNPIAAWDGTHGSPVGSMKITATFTAYNQAVDALVNFPAVNLTGQTLHAQVMPESGAFSGFVQFHTSDSCYSYQQMPSQLKGLVAATWTPVALVVPPFVPLTSPPACGGGWDPSKIVQIGVQFGFYGAAEVAPAPVFPITVSVYIDTVTN